MFVAALAILKPTIPFPSSLALDHAHQRIATYNAFIMLLLLQLECLLVPIIYSSRVVVVAAKAQS
jgi:hypothetical protein